MQVQVLSPGPKPKGHSYECPFGFGSGLLDSNPAALLVFPIVQYKKAAEKRGGFAEQMVAVGYQAVL